MKVALHSNQLDGPGSDKTPYDYAVGLRNRLGHDVSFITSSRNPAAGVQRISLEFPVYTYDWDINTAEAEDIRGDLEHLVETQKIDFIQFLKYGQDDQITPSNCRTGVHCSLDMSQPHGTVYAGVSKTLARKFNQPLFVPHIVSTMAPTRDLRKDLNIPADAFVFGRHGAINTFDIPFVHQAVLSALNLRKDIYFVFLSTKRFCDHERVIHLPWVDSEQEKFNVIHACDAMLHGRIMGETFGVSVGEFSAANKPVLTWSGKGFSAYQTAHLDILGSKALVYNTVTDLLSLLIKCEKKTFEGTAWDVYSEAYSEKSVMEQYAQVFLGNAAVGRSLATEGFAQR